MSSSIDYDSPVSRWSGDAEYGKRQIAALREEKRFRDHMGDARRQDTPIEQVDRSNPDNLFDLMRTHFTHEQAEAMGTFLKRFKTGKWMQKQRGYVAKVALAVSSRSRFDGLGYAYCRPGRLCGDEDHCPLCHLEERIRPALQEYGNVFDRANYWFAAIPSLSYRPDRAGLSYVIRKRQDGSAKEYRHDYPFSGPERRGLTLDSGADFDALVRLLRAPYAFAQSLIKAGLADGAYANHEIKIEFIPQPNSPLKVGDIVLPHGNILLNGRRKPDWRFAQECWKAYLKVWEDLGLLDFAYPDLVIGKAMVDQAEINRWVSYSLKPLQFEKFYGDGIRAGCRLDHLNLHFDQMIFDAIKEPLRSVRSPRKYGNLNNDYRNRRYIGNKPPDRTLKRIRNKIAKSIKRNPQADPFDTLAATEVHFLITHGWLRGLRLTEEALDKLFPER